MRGKQAFILFSLIGALLVAMMLPLACGDDDTEKLNDEERLVIAKGMIDKYVKYFSDMNIDQLVALYAGYASIMVPEAGTFNTDSYRTYLGQLYAPMEVVVVTGTDREVLMVTSTKANVKFRAWYLLRTEAEEFFAYKTWNTWQMNWSNDSKWRIADETGEDKLDMQRHLGTFVEQWANAWEAMNLDTLVGMYSADARIVEDDGQEYTPTEYRALLKTQFAELESIDSSYALFDVEWFTWEAANVLFQLQLTKTAVGGPSIQEKITYGWEMKPGDGDQWLVKGQSVRAQEIGDDDTTDDDTADDDTTDDDTADDDIADDDTADDDTADDDTIDDNLIN